MFKIKAELRKICGKRASGRLRMQDKIPAIIYGYKIDNILIQLDKRIIDNLKFKENLYNKKLILVIGRNEFQVILKDIQYHPFKPKIYHMDFYILSSGT